MIHNTVGPNVVPYKGFLVTIQEPTFDWVKGQYVHRNQCRVSFQNGSHLITCLTFHAAKLAITKFLNLAGMETVTKPKKFGGTK